MKTIFIVIARGFLIRNILRSGVLHQLKKGGARVVVLVNNEKRQRELPQELRDEFEDSQVTLIPVRDAAIKGYSLFAKITGLLMYNHDAWQHSNAGGPRRLKRAFFWKYLEAAVFFPLSKIHLLKRLARLLEERYFYSPMYASYYDTYKPDVVFSTSIISKFDIYIMKEARRRGIPTVSMPKGWDNVTKRMYRFLPDMLLVQNERMKAEVVRQQRMTPERVKVVGFPQFDWYARPEVLLSREEYCKRVGLDPKRAIIFYGSAGIWAPGERRILDILAAWVRTPGALARESSLFIRPHYSEAKAPRLDAYRSTPHVVVDENFTFTDYFSDWWNPGVEETILFTNLVFHADVIVNISSTLTLDGACFDKPIVCIGYGVLHHPKTKKDLSIWYYRSDHFRWVLETKAVTVVYSDSELKKAINDALTNPQELAKERKILRQKLCYRVDGKSSERVAHELLNISKKRVI